MSTQAALDAMRAALSAGFQVSDVASAAQVILTECVILLTDTTEQANALVDEIAADVKADAEKHRDVLTVLDATLEAMAESKGRTRQ